MFTTEECVAINSHEPTTESKYAFSRTIPRLRYYRIETRLHKRRLKTDLWKRKFGTSTYFAYTTCTEEGCLRELSFFSSRGCGRNGKKDSIKL